MRLTFFISAFLICIANITHAEGPPTHEQFMRACNELNVGEACWAAAFSYEAGKDLHNNNIGQDIPRSVKLYKKGCELDEARACFNLANNYLSGKYKNLPAINNSYNDSNTLLEKGCTLKHAKSCFNYAVVWGKFANGKGKARWGYKNACKYGIQEACQRAKSN